MPNQPKTPLRAYRIPEELRARMKARAERDAVTESDVVRAALEEYLKTD